MGLDIGTHAGLLAQQVETVLPNLVTNVYRPAQLDTAGVEISPQSNYKGIRYNELIPYLIAANNELSSKVDSLINALNASSIQKPNSQVNERIGQQVELKDVTTIILNQNDPNPFTESTRITFVIPEEVKVAKMIFTNQNGSVINTVFLQERGTGEIQVFASDLSSGIYTYTLVCDGKVIDSKKMMKN